MYSYIDIIEIEDIGQIFSTDQPSSPTPATPPQPGNYAQLSRSILADTVRACRGQHDSKPPSPAPATTAQAPTRRRTPSTCGEDGKPPPDCPSKTEDPACEHLSCSTTKQQNESQ